VGVVGRQSRALDPEQQQPDSSNPPSSEWLGSIAPEPVQRRIYDGNRQLATAIARCEQGVWPARARYA
jgi:hypothetical protein